jgi:hypothetical protein
MKPERRAVDKALLLIHRLARRSGRAAEQRVPADRLDRSDFGIQKQQNGLSDVLMLASQPAAEAQAVGPLSTATSDDTLL